MIERPTSKQKEEERKEFGDLFVNFEDDSDSELIDFVPKKVREVLLDGSNNALNQRINEWLHMIVRILGGVGNGGKHFAPQYKTVHVLPIVNSLVRLFFLKIHGVSQMNRQLSYVDEDMLIGELGVGAVEFD